MRNLFLLALAVLLNCQLQAQQSPSWFTGYYSSGPQLKFTEAHNHLLPTADTAGNVFMVFQYTDSLILDGTVYRSNGKNSFVIRKTDKFGKAKFNVFAQTRSGGRKVVLNSLFALRDGGFVFAVSTDDTIDMGKQVLGVQNRNSDESYVLRFNADGSLRYKIHFNGGIPSIRPGYKHDLVVYDDFKSPDYVTVNGKSYDPIYNRDLILQVASNGSIVKTYNRFSSLVDWTEDLKGNMYLFCRIYSTDTAKGMQFVDTTLFPSSKSGIYNDHIILALKSNGNVKWIFRLDSAHGSNSGFYKFGVDRAGRIYFCDHIGRAFKYQGKILMSSDNKQNRALFGVLDSNGNLLRYFFDASYNSGEEQSITMFPTAWVGDDVELKVWAGDDFRWPQKAYTEGPVFQSFYYNFVKDSFIDGLNFEASLAEQRNYYKRNQRWGTSIAFGGKGGGMFVGNDLYYNKGGNDFMGFFFDPDIKANKMEFSKVVDVFIYPNPALGQLRISGNGKIQSLVLYSGNGREITKFQYTGKEIELTLPQLPSGLYFITGECNGDIFSRPFVLSK